MTRPIAVALTFAILAACGKPSENPVGDDYTDRMTHEHRADTPAPSPAAQGATAQPVRSQTVRYAAVNGRDVHGYLSYPTAAEGGLPGVLVFHEWWGLNENIRAMTDQLAAQGYVALAADLYGGQVAKDPQAARALLDAALKDREAMGQNLRQAHAYLQEQVKATRIGTIGWCFGGVLSLRTALLVPEQVHAAVVYYGHVSTDANELKPLKAPVLAHFGGADASIPVEHVQRFEGALKALGKPAQVFVYDGAAHAFANPSGGNYRAEAATAAWQRSLAFLAEHLKGE